MDQNQLSDFTIDPRDLSRPTEPTSQQAEPSELPVPEPVELPVPEPDDIPEDLERPLSDKPSSVDFDDIEPGFPIDTEPTAEEQTTADTVVEELPVADAPSQPVAASSDELIAKIGELEKSVAELSAKLEARQAMAQQSTELFDKMYAELQSYKNDLYSKLLKPFVLSTISLLDDTNRFIERLGEGDEKRAADYLRTIPDDLQDILETNGVVLYQDESDTFNPRTQRSVKQVPTADMALNNKIANRVRPGYYWNGANLRPETVWIYKFDAKLAAEKPQTEIQA